MQPSRSTPRRSRLLRPAALALAAALLATGAARAAVSTTTPADEDGSFENIAYGSSGNIFQLIPRLFVQGVGNAASPDAVSTLNPLLQYDFGLSGDGSDRLTIEYRVRNTSAVESFSQLRFMVFANPDGDPVNFQDTVSESWGARLDGDPVRREGRNFNAGNTILSGIALANNLNEQPAPLDISCTGAGCDANVALQWNADLLRPGEMLRVRVGLSDNGQVLLGEGQALPGRFLTISAVGDAGTVLTFSGNSAVVAVPEPGSTALLLAGLLGLGFLARRRNATADQV